MVDVDDSLAASGDSSRGAETGGEKAESVTIRPPVRVADLLTAERLVEPVDEDGRTASE